MADKRKLDNWIESWVDYTAPLPSPELWRLWGGITTLAGALERKVWIRTGIGPLYPNLYTVMVGPPGLGKTAVTSKVRYFWQQLTDTKQPQEGLHLSASSTTSASIVDDLRDASRRIIRMQDDPPTVDFNSLAICSNELGVLLPEYDHAMMNKLTDIYDGHPYSERRRTNDLNFVIEQPQINLMAGCTPAYLTEMLPPGAWDQGFLSRTLLVFSTENLRRAVFTETKLQADLEKVLLADLHHIFKHENVFGPITLEEEPRKRLEAWHSAGGPPIPEHPRLQHYLTRRTAHLLKLMMVACMSAGDRRVITTEHLDTALGWLLQMEIYLGDIFRAMVVGGDAQAMNEAWFHFASEHAKSQKPIHERRIIEFLAARVPAHSVVRVLEIMERSGMLEKTLLASGVAYIPRQRKR